MTITIKNPTIIQTKTDPNPYTMSIHASVNQSFFKPTVQLIVVNKV